MRPRKPTVVVAGALLALTACSGGGSDPAPTTSPSPTEASAEPTTEAPTDAATSATPAGVRFPECEPAEGKTVTDLEDIVIEAVELPEERWDDFTYDGETIPGYVLEAAEIPERVLERGCIVEYEAPGGCLPAVEISGAYIPPYTVPERVLPAVTLPDGTVVEEVVLPAVTVEEVVVEGASVDEVCQTEDEEAEPGSFVSAVYRDAIYRDAAYQDAAYQDAGYRDFQYLDAGTVPGVSIVGGVGAPASIPPETVGPAILEGYVLEGAEDVEVSSKDDEVYYTSEGDVLFGNDEDVLQPAAEAELAAVVADIASRGTAVKIRIEGHTDDVGTEEHNLDLSQRRAEAVATWLAEEGGLDRGIMTTTGHGYAYPRADNATDEGRAQNRRVVITVAVE